MSRFRKVYTEFWKDPKVLEEMTPEDKYFFLYLLTNPNTNQIGIYRITKKEMAFTLGYSPETINALMERFENKLGFIRYNTDTRELAIKNWGRYNLDRAGKPMIDCITKELTEVKDLSLIEYVGERIKNDTLRKEFEAYYDNNNNNNNDTYHDTYHDTSTSRGEEQEQEQEQEEEKEQEQEGVTSEASSDLSLDDPRTEVIQYLNKKVGAGFSPKAKGTKEFMNARFKEGATVEEMKQIIDLKCEQWLKREEMAGYIRPTTLFRPSNYHNYRNELQIKQTTRNQKQKDQDKRYKRYDGYDFDKAEA